MGDPRHGRGPQYQVTALANRSTFLTFMIHALLHLSNSGVDNIFVVVFWRKPCRMDLQLGAKLSDWFDTDGAANKNQDRTQIYYLLSCVGLHCFKLGPKMQYAKQIPKWNHFPKLEFLGFS